MPVLTSLNLDGPVGFPQTRALEGPARTAQLPAPAAGVSAGRDTAGLVDPIDRPGAADVLPGTLDVPAASGGGRGAPPQPPPVGGGPGGEGGVPDKAGGTRTGRRWWLVAAVAGVVALAVVLTGEALRPPSPGPRVLTDQVFGRAANDVCARTMPGLRPPDGGPFGSAVTPAQVAGQIDKAASGLDDLANRLGALPAAVADRPHIAAWLDAWHRYDAVGHQYADYLRNHDPSGKAPPVLKTGVGLAKTVDDFARANGLDACQFAFAYNPDPSQF